MRQNEPLRNAATGLRYFIFHDLWAKRDIRLWLDWGWITDEQADRLSRDADRFATITAPPYWYAVEGKDGSLWCEGKFARHRVQEQAVRWFRRLLCDLGREYIEKPMDRDEKEQKWVRGPLARMFNNTGFTRWIPNPNLQWMLWKKKEVDAQGLAAESGKPDGYIHLPGSRMAYVEFKVDEGSLDLGCWRDNQRDWRTKNCLNPDTDYWLGVWVSLERDITRANHDKARCYLVPAETWLELEQASLSAGSRTVAVVPENQRIHELKHLWLDSPQWFGPYALERAAGEWAIPNNHPLKEGIFVA